MQFGKRLSKGSVSRLMRILGFTVQRALYWAWLQGAELVKQWQAEEFLASRVEAKATGAVIYIGDEAGMRSGHHAGTTWAPARGCFEDIEMTKY